MGRRREFDPERAVAAAGELFAREGYEGSSMDQLLRASGLNRGSLYGTFGSKRGLFVACLRAASGTTGTDTDLLLVALMELSWRDAEVRSLCTEAVDALGDGAEHTLGRRLLDRAALATTEPEPTTPQKEESR